MKGVEATDEYSDELVARLTPAQKRIIRPIEPSKPPVMQRRSL